MSQNKITRESLANQLSQEFGIAYTTAYKKIDNILWSSPEEKILQECEKVIKDHCGHEFYI